MKKRAIGAVIAAIVIAIAAGCSGGTIQDNDKVYFPEGFRGKWKNSSGYEVNIRADYFEILAPDKTKTTNETRYFAYNATPETSSDDRVVTITAHFQNVDMSDHVIIDKFTLSPSGDVLTIDLTVENPLHIDELNKAN